MSSVSGALITAVLCFLYAVLMAGIAYAFTRDRQRFLSEFGRNWLIVSAGAFIGAVMITQWIRLPIDTGTAAAGAWIWLWKRKRKDRAPRMYGAKSRALVAALVRKAREAARPRPVLRPQPGGAR